MLLWKTIDIADDELGLLFFRERFYKVLEPGRRRVSVFGDFRAEKHSVSDVVFSHAKAKFLTRTYASTLVDYIDTFETLDTEVGLIYHDGRLVDVLPPGKFYATWRGLANVRVDVISIKDSFSIDSATLDLLSRDVIFSQATEAARSVEYVEVSNEQVGLLFVNGKYNRSVVVKYVDLRLQSIDVSGQEILTKDRVSLRVNLSASYKVIDPKLAALKLSDYAGFIYRELQLRLREAVGTQTLDALLEDKNTLNQVIASDIRDKLIEYGVEIVGVGVKDIILPGDMKLILNQVVEAQKEAEANLIRRKEETQAMRSLHNTAKVMENNPLILRLKELESLEKVAEKVDRISVYGGFDGVMNDLVKIPSA